MTSPLVRVRDLLRRLSARLVAEGRRERLPTLVAHGELQRFRSLRELR